MTTKNKILIALGVASVIGAYFYFKTKKDDTTTSNASGSQRCGRNLNTCRSTHTCVNGECIPPPKSNTYSN